MRPSIALLLFAPAVSLPACFEGDVALFGCPEDEVCSEDTPDGLFFFGAGLAGTVDLGNAATAVGGIQQISLERQIGDSFVPLTAGYVASGGAFVAVEQTDEHVVTVRGQASGGNKIEIRDLDGALMDRKTFTAAELSTIDIVPDLPEASDLPFAFLAGTVRAGIALRAADGVRLVDEAMTVEVAGGTQVAWDLVEVPAAQPGALQAVVTAAGTPAVTLDIPIVAQVDELTDTLLLLAEDQDTLVVDQGAFACFAAIAGGTHQVANLAWTVTGEGDAEIGVDLFGSKRCVSIQPTAAGEVTLTATAAGLTKVVTYPIVEAPAKPRRATRAAPSPASRAGDRAESTGPGSRSR